jgi:ABC-type phosphate transport system substrate-binding protein
MWKKILILVLAGGLWACGAMAQDKSGDLAIVVGKSCSLDNVTSAELAKIFRAEKSKDANGVRFFILTREAGSAERTAALAGIYKLSEDDYAKYFLQATFIGLVQSAPREMSSSPAMLGYVVRIPGAIGYVRASDADDSVKILKVDGHAPGEAGYPLKVK